MDYFVHGTLSLSQKEQPAATLEIAHVFGIIGGALACTLLVIQQANFMWHDAAIAAADGEATKELLHAAYTGANRVQMAMDVAFNIFITIA